MDIWCTHILLSLLGRLCSVQKKILTLRVPSTSARRLIKGKSSSNSAMSIFWVCIYDHIIDTLDVHRWSFDDPCSEGLLHNPAFRGAPNFDIPVPTCWNIAAKNSCNLSYDRNTTYTPVNHSCQGPLQSGDHASVSMLSWCDLGTWYIFWLGSLSVVFTNPLQSMLQPQH